MNTDRVAGLGLAVLAGVCVLGACGPTTAGPAPAQPTSAAATTSSAATSAQPDTGGAAAASSSRSAGGSGTPRCTTGDLSVSVGTPKKGDSADQFDVPLTFRNTSSHTCGLHGVPGVDLVGPKDPNGTVYHLPRTDNGVRANDVAPGGSATATITVLGPSEGSVGSNGSVSWTPTKLVTIPPGQTAALTAAWPSGVAVLRQDEATHPGSYVNGILADPA